jgi:membrane protein implicated in regulation of membrane protease activity
MLRASTYWIAFILSLCLVLASGLCFFYLWNVDASMVRNRPWGDQDSISAFWYFVIILLLSSIITVLAILLGWRLDRRQVKNLEQKTTELEQTNQALGLKLLAAQAPPKTSHTPPGPNV